MSYSDRKEGNWDYQRVSGQLKAQEKAQKEAIKAAEKAQKKAAKSSRRSYSAPKNLTVDQVMADYNSWNAKQPQTAEQVMADFNAWNTDADAWMKSQTPVQTSAQGSSRRVVPMDTFTPFNQGKQDKKEEQGATRIHFDPTKQERPDPSAITKGGIPELGVTDSSSAYSQVMDYKEKRRKAEENKAAQGERHAKVKEERLAKNREKAADIIAKEDKRYHAVDPKRPFANYSDAELNAAVATIDPLRTSMSARETARVNALEKELQTRKLEKNRAEFIGGPGSYDKPDLSNLDQEELARQIAQRRNGGQNETPESVNESLDGFTKGLYALGAGEVDPIIKPAAQLDKAIANATGTDSAVERTAKLDPTYTTMQIAANNARNREDYDEAQRLENTLAKRRENLDVEKGLEQAAEQNGLAYGAGKLATIIGENILLGNLLEGAGWVANTGNKALDFAANQGIKLIPDLATDTLPEVIDAYSNGERGLELAGTAAKNAAINAAFNIGTDAVGALIPYLKKLRSPADDVAKAANLSPLETAAKDADVVDDIAEQAQKQADDLENYSIESLPETTIELDGKGAVRNGVNPKPVDVNAKPLDVNTKPEVDNVIKNTDEGIPIKNELEGDELATSGWRKGTAEKSGLLDGYEDEYPEEAWKYYKSTEDIQHEVAKARYANSADLAGDLTKKQNYDAADVKASMDEWGRLLAAGDTDSIAKAQKLSRRIDYEGREGGRVVQAFAEYSRDPGVSGLKQAQTSANMAIDKHFGAGTSEAVNNLAMKIDDALADVDFRDRDEVVARLTELLEPDLKAYAPANKAMQESGSRAILGKEKILKNVKKGKYSSPEEIIDEIYKQNHVYHLTADEQKKVYDLLTETAKYADGSYEKEALYAQAAKICMKHVPTTMGNRVRSILYNNMLGNIKTAVSRNFFGNAAFQGLEQTRQPLAAGIDWLVSKKTGQHTTTGWSKGKAKAYLEGFKKGGGDEWRDVLRHINTGRSGEFGWEEALKNNKTTWGKGIGKLADQAEFYVSAAMKFGDRPFYEANYAQSLYELRDLVSRYGKDGVAGLKGVPEENLDDVIDMIASVRAADSVFQKQGKWSAGLTKVRDAIGDMSEGTLGVDIMSTASTPFAMTPGNMVERAIEYTPIGFGKNLAETLVERSKGTFNQRRAVDELSRSITGLPLLYGGYKLAENGLVNGGYSSDKDERRAQQDDGYIEYGLNIPEGVPLVGGMTFDTSDLPVIGPFMQAGSAINEKGLSPMSSLQAAEAVLGGSATQGLRKALGADSGSMGYSSNDSVMENAANVLGSSATQLVPSLARQTAQFLDPYKRDLGEYGTPEYYKNSVVNSLPIIRQTLPEKVDNEGYIVQQNQGRTGFEKFMEDYVYPMNVSEYNPSELNQEADRLRDETSDHTHKAYIPTADRNDLRDEFEKYEKEYSEEAFRKYKIKLGKTSRELGTKFINSEWYQSLAPDEQADALSKAYSVAKQVALKKASGEAIEGKNAKIYQKFGADGLLSYLQAKSDMGDSTSNYAAVNALMNLDEDKRAKMLPYLIDLETKGKINTNGKFVEKYGANALIEFLDNGYKATGRNELPKTKDEAYDAALMYPASKQREMYDEYISRIHYSQTAKTTQGEEEAFQHGGMKALGAYVEREGIMKQHGGEYDDYAKSIEQEGGIPALEQYGRDLQGLEPYGLNTGGVHKVYSHAKSAYPEMGYGDFANLFTYVDSLGNSKGEGKNNRNLSQEEICAAMTANPEKAEMLQNMFWTSDKKVPVLKNGKYVPAKKK